MNAPSSPVITRSLARTVDDMLLDAGETDARLRSALLSLGSLRSLPVPEPGAELAALLLSGPAHQLERHRLLRRHRGSVVGLAVIAGMGLGVTGVAATGSVPDGSANSSVQQMLADWSPAWTIAAAPLAVPEGAGLPVELQTPGDQASGDQAVGGGAAGQADPSGPGDAQPGNPGAGASQAGTGHQGNSGSAGKGNGADGSSSTTNDDGAAGNAAGGNAGGTAAKDAASGDGGEPAGNAGSAAAGGQDKAGKSGPVTSTVEDAAPLLAKTGKTAAGKADQGLIWLKKFSR
ncbi:hypothetical protein [Arthrobacter sp. HMWF013]|uniref:hypothetical protein n=1 Tax=Arthrobacter sp. HMWF013 TaxID=2056849 RepID=UPI000D379A26|nr:hypothetical protein [Arthrobacter sp. HMWF013]PTT67795.1 hypothetical protein DBR22_08095 [Arthrobacter sp. HMWF013]